MKRYWANVENGEVLNVIVSADSPGAGWVETWRKGEQRFNYAGIGYTYDEERDAFIPPKPFDSWVLNEETCLWEAPIPYPNDGLVYSWDEASGDWIEVVEPSA